MIIIAAHHELGSRLSHAVPERHRPPWLFPFPTAGRDRQILGV